MVYVALHTPLGIGALFALNMFVGVPHYLSSFTFFLGDENLDYYKTRFLVFFAGPLIIITTVTILWLCGLSNIVAAVVFVWNVYHVASQSSGILSIYRRLGGGHATEGHWARFAIIFVNATMAFWFMDRFPPLSDFLVTLHPELPVWVRYACLAAAIYFCIGYFRCLIRRPNPLMIPEKSFLAISLLLFHPYLWVEDSSIATYGMLTGHFLQYLAIVWLLNRRKYVPPSGSGAQQWLGRISQSLPMLLSWTLLAGVLFYALAKASIRTNTLDWYLIFFNSMALTHFYLDGLIWAFKNPFVRRTVGPYLGVSSHQLRPAVV